MCTYTDKIKLLIQSIHIYIAYLEVVSSSCNLRMFHAMVTPDPLKMGSCYFSTQNSTCLNNIWGKYLTVGGCKKVI